MSKNRVIETEFRDWGLLLEAVKALGIPHEVGEGLAMWGYDGQLRPQTANLAIRRQYVGSAANDLGFIRRADGGIDMIISEYDLTGPGKRLLDRIKQQYAIGFIERQARRIGARVKRERRADGSVVVYLAR